MSSKTKIVHFPWRIPMVMVSRLEKNCVPKKLIKILVKHRWFWLWKKVSQNPCVFWSKSDSVKSKWAGVIVQWEMSGGSNFDLKTRKKWTFFAPSTSLKIKLVFGSGFASAKKNFDFLTPQDYAQAIWEKKIFLVSNPLPNPTPHGTPWPPRTMPRPWAIDLRKKNFLVPKPLPNPTPYYLP